MRIYRCLMIGICGTILFSFQSVSEINVESQEKLSCETLTFFFSLWKDSAFGKNPNGVERAAWIIQDADGNQIFQKWRNSGERNKEYWKGPIPPSVAAVVHTHPVQRDFRPSPADVLMAKRVNIPVYVISENGLWMSDPDGKISRVLKYLDFKEALKNCASSEDKTKTVSALETDH